MRKVCSDCLCVFFVSGSEVSACLSYVFELAIFAFHLVDAALRIYVCGVVSRLYVVLYRVSSLVCYAYVGVF
jgi:hypothetical protein